jgi:hypothetical protein
MQSDINGFLRADYEYRTQEAMKYSGGDSHRTVMGLRAGLITYSQFSVSSF